jgi:hypothetical protein
MKPAHILQRSDQKRLEDEVMRVRGVLEAGESP